jgi:hypothetical protein
MSDQHAAPGAHGADHDDAGHDDAAHGDATHGDATHGGDHGSHGDGHDGMGLGPIDWTMWGVGIVGVLSALVVVAGFVIATSFVFAA